MTFLNTNLGPNLAMKIETHIPVMVISFNVYFAHIINMYNLQTERYIYYVHEQLNSLVQLIQFPIFIKSLLPFQSVTQDGIFYVLVMNLTFLLNWYWILQ